MSMSCTINIKSSIKDELFEQKEQKLQSKMRGREPPSQETNQLG